MKKADAVIEIIHDGRSERAPTQTGVNRILKALKTLDLNRAECLRVLGYLDIVREDGTPYNKPLDLSKLPKE